jgi:hypothetical protein
MYKVRSLQHQQTKCIEAKFTCQEPPLQSSYLIFLSMIIFWTYRYMKLSCLWSTWTKPLETAWIRHGRNQKVRLGWFCARANIHSSLKPKPCTGLNHTTVICLFQKRSKINPLINKNILLLTVRFWYTLHLYDKPNHSLEFCLLNILIDFLSSRQALWLFNSIIGPVSLYI